MNLQEFFTSHKTEAPQLTPFWYGMMFLGIIYVMYSAVKYHKNRRYQNFLKAVQGLQILMLYGWYIVTLSPISDHFLFIIADWRCLLFCYCLILQPINSILRF